MGPDVACVDLVAAWGAVTPKAGSTLLLLPLFAVMSPLPPSAAAEARPGICFRAVRCLRGPPLVLPMEVRSDSLKLGGGTVPPMVYRSLEFFMGFSILPAEVDSEAGSLSAKVWSKLRGAVFREPFAPVSSVTGCGARCEAVAVGAGTLALPSVAHPRSLPLPQPVRVLQSLPFLTSLAVIPRSFPLPPAKVLPRLVGPRLVVLALRLELAAVHAASETNRTVFAASGWRGPFDGLTPGTADEYWARLELMRTGETSPVSSASRRSSLRDPASARVEGWAAAGTCEPPSSLTSDHSS